MGIRLVHKSNGPIVSKLRSKPSLTLIKSEETPILWPGDPQTIPMQKIMPYDFICHFCQKTPDVFSWVNQSMIYCGVCQNLSLQKRSL